MLTGNFIEDQKYSDLIPIASKLLKQYPGKIAMPVDVALNKDGERVEVRVEPRYRDDLANF